jgi:hypothetical protein
MTNNYKIDMFLQFFEPFFSELYLKRVSKE